jgi:uncharacterized protein YjgD (DUF1641 family)
MTETQVVEYNVTDAAIAEMSDLYMGLVITDLEDKEQFDAVHSARLVVKGKRIEVGKRRKELKAGALAYGREVDSKANHIFERLEPIETHLKTEEFKAEAEKQRLEDIRIAKIKDEIDSWIKAYTEMNGMGKVDELKGYIAKLEAIRDLISPELYFEFTGEAIETCNSLLVRAKNDLETRERLDREEVERKAESERLKKVADEQEVERERLQKIADEQAAKLFVEQAKITAAQKKIDNEKAALEAEKKADQERKDREVFSRKAVERAKDAAIAKAKQDAIDKAYAEKEAAEEADRQEGLKPDKEKLAAFSQFLLEGLSYPEVYANEARKILNNACKEIEEIAVDILDKSQGM